MDGSDLTTEEYVEISHRVRSGEYFKEAKHMANTYVSDHMSERYWYILITVIAISITIVSIIASSGLFPLKPRVAFVYSANDIVEDIPRIVPLVDYHNEDADLALRRYLVKHYIELREEYDPRTFDGNQEAIQAFSEPSVVFREYMDYVSSKNPRNPVSIYQRHTIRKINVLSFESIKEGSGSGNARSYTMKVVFESILKVGENLKTPTRHQVDIDFLYKNIKLDETTGKIEPYGFMVTSYRTKEL